MLTLATKTVTPLIAGTGLIERLAGMTYKVEKRDKLSGSADGSDIIRKQTFPVSANVNSVECFQKGRYKDLVPNTSLRSIGYWECVQPEHPVSASDANSLFHRGAGKGRDIYRGILRFVFVANIAKLNINNLYGNDSDINPLIKQSILNQINEKDIIIDSPVFTNCHAKFVYLGGEKMDVNQVFPYTYDDLNINVLGLYPFTFSAMNFEVFLFINKSCIGQIEAGTALDCKII